MARRILVPLDGSPGAETIVEVLERLGLKAGATLILLHTVMPTAAPGMAGPVPMEGPTALPDDLYEAERAESTRYLAGVRDRLAAQGVSSECAVWEGPPAETIARAQTELGADLVAMATHARSGLGRLLLGNVADAVIRHATAPVLVTRLPDEAEDGEDAADL